MGIHPSQQPVDFHARQLHLRPTILPYDFPGDHIKREDQLTTLVIGTVVWGIFAGLTLIATTYKT